MQQCVLEAVLPWLTVKRDIAEIALKFIEVWQREVHLPCVCVGGGVPYSTEVGVLLEQAYAMKFSR